MRDRPILKCEDVAEILGMNTQVVRRMARLGELPAYRPPGARVYRFFEDEIYEWLRSHRFKPPAKGA